jgi:hypothetical protein
VESFLEGVHMVGIGSGAQREAEDFHFKYVRPVRSLKFSNALDKSPDS